MRTRPFVGVLCLAVLVFLVVPLAVPAADQPLKPYLLGYRGPGTIEAKLPELRAALQQQGFQVAGEYAPYKGTHILAVTSDGMKAAAAKSAFGGYGAAVRIALTQTDKELQVAATDPRYLAAAYRMKDPLDEVAEAVGRAIGGKEPFGSKEGIAAAKLRKYHYMVMMPYFDDHIELAAYPSQDEALKAVEANLAAKAGGSSLVYRVDVPGKKETVFGVAVAEGEGADAGIMKIIDIADLKHTAHLPYEILVSDGKVFMLHGKFRIAIDFPDLTMGTFMKISGAPAAIEGKMKAVAGGK